MRCLAMVIGAALPLVALAAEPTPPAAELDATIEQGLKFLRDDALAWKQEHNCVSCHHAGLVVWAMREAKLRDYQVDEDVFAELTNWVANSGDGTTGVPRPEGRPRAFNEKAAHFAAALGADPEPDDATKAAVARLLVTVKKDQIDDGSWQSWPKTRAPIFGLSDNRSTALATLALLAPSARDDQSAHEAAERGLAWLAAHASEDDAQSLALRVAVLKRRGRTEGEIAPLAKRIRDAQNGDGGWSQTPEMASDAWATGQALYALAQATSGDEAVRRGQSFLMGSQRENGSWPMISRPTEPGGEGSQSLIPITGAGSAWAVIGLCRSR